MADELDQGADSPRMADVIELSPLRLQTPERLRADAQALATLLDDPAPLSPATQLRLIQRLQGIWDQLPPVDSALQAHLRVRTCERLSLRPERFDFLMHTRENSVVRKTLGWWPGEDPVLQPDERYLLEIGGWVGRFVRWAYRSKCHLAFHVWSALAALGAAARRNYYIPAGIDDFIYPNLFVMIVGDSGSGKSFAIGAARSLVRKMNELLEAAKVPPGAPDKAVHLVEDSITKAALEERLRTPARRRCAPLEIHDHPNQWESVAMLVADEAVQLLGRDNYEVETLIVAMTRMHDGHYASDTLSRKEFYIPNLAVTVLLGSAMSWLRKTMTDTVFAGGFMGARCLPIDRDAITDPARAKQYPKIPILDPVEAHELAKYLTRLATAHPREMVWDPDAEARYVEWYRQPDPPELDERVRSYYARRFLHVQKVSMLLALSRDPEAHITLPDVEGAITIMLHEEAHMFSTMISMVTRGAASDDAEWLRTALLRAGGHMHRQQLSRLASRKMRAREYRDVLQALIDSGELGMRRNGVLGGGSRDTIYLTEYEDSEGNRLKRPPR